MGDDCLVKMEFKKIKTKNLQFLLVATAVLIVILGAYVSAFAVGFESTELNLYPGQVHDTAFSLQNYGTGVSDIVVEATIEEGEDYMTFVDGTTSFEVPANSNSAAFVRITVPQNAQVGDNLDIVVLFRVVGGNVGGGEVEGEGTGTVGFAFAYRPTVVVNVVEEKPAEPVAPVIEPVEEKTTAGSTAWIWVLIGIVIIVIVVWMILRRKKG